MKKYHADLQDEVERNEKRLRLHEESLARCAFDQYVQLERGLMKDEKKYIKEMQKMKEAEREKQKETMNI
jgi:hypothetical protein